MFKRVLLKLSGESLGGPEGRGLDTECLKQSSMAEATYSEASRDWKKDSTELTGIGWACWRRSSTPLRSNSSLRMKG